MCGRDIPLPKASWLDVSMIYFRKEDLVTLAALFFSAPDNIAVVSDSCHPAGPEAQIEHWKNSFSLISLFLHFYISFASCIRS